MPNSKKIEFAMESPVFNKLGLMKNVVPEWFKKAEKFMGGKLDIDPPTLTVKNCIPFLDTYLSGYYIPTPIDLLVLEENGDVVIKWRHGVSPGNDQFIGVRDGSMTQGMSVPHGYHDKHFTWMTKHVIKSPEGYSLLFTQPLNRLDLPTYTLSGIVDAEYILNGGNLPFFVKKGFTGVIPAGTPVVQIIPIKREKWELIENNNLLKVGQENSQLSRKHIIGFYKNKFWHKKEYN